MFISELIGLPNSMIVQALEITTALLLKVVRMGSDAWLLSFCTPPLIVLCIPPLLGLYSILRLKRAWIRVSFLVLTLVGFCVLLQFYGYITRKAIHYIPCHTGQLSAFPLDGRITLIDPGFLSRKPVSESWIVYTLMPALAKETGAVSIDCLVFLTFNQRILETLALLAQTMTIRHVVLPFCTGRLSPNTWRLLLFCKKTVTQKGGTWTSVHTRKVPLSVTRDHTLFICPTDTQITYHKATYPALMAVYTDSVGTVTSIKSTKDGKKSSLLREKPSEQPEPEHLLCQSS